MQVSGETRRDETWTRTARLRYGRRFARTPREIVLQSSIGPLSDAGDDLFSLALMPAMLRGEDLAVEAPLSARLLEAATAIQAILQAFGPSFGHALRQIAVHARPSRDRLPAAGRGVACFFSGGLDSFFTALRHREELDALIHVQGFDIDLRDAPMMESMLPRVRAIARELGIDLIEVRTDIRSLSDRSMHWGLYHGPALAYVAQALQPLFRKVYVGSSSTNGLDWVMENGSHPMLDPLWSTESIQLVHDGVEFSRFSKAEFIAGFEVAREHLHVCYQNVEGEYNCRRCQKCVFTALQIAAAGKLEAFPTLDGALTPEGVLGMSVPERVTPESMSRCLRRLRALGARPEIQAAILNRLDAWTRELREPRREPTLRKDWHFREYGATRSGPERPDRS